MIKKLWIMLAVIGCIFLTGCAGTNNQQEWIIEDSSDENTEKPIEEIGSCEAIDTVEKIYIYICGEVNNPGVYSFTAHQRVYEAIEKAGGLTKKADDSCVNQASELNDGDMIYISSMDEANGGESKNAIVSDGRININKASVSELQNINGIGESRAIAIAEFRQKNGSFKETKDIMQVPGIKSGLYEKIKDQIKID